MVIIKKIIEVRKKEKCVESLNFKLHLFSEFFLIDVLETFKSFAELYSAIIMDMDMVKWHQHL